MPHSRQRYLQKILEKALKASSIVGILGQRQTGKTTLTELMAAEYVTLDDEDQLELALRAARSYIQNRKSPFAIDECQHSPALFPALKEYVRVKKQMGQFILTGSVRFTSVEDIKESLTGRIIDFELLPLSVSEIKEVPLFSLGTMIQNSNLQQFLQQKKQKCDVNRKVVENFLSKGGLPGICFLRSEALRTQKMRSHLKTILDRDLRTVTKTQLDYLTLKTFLEEIAIQQGEVFDLSRAARGARIAINSARKILAGLESVYLIRILPKGGETDGRLVYFEDQGMATFLLKERGISLSDLRVLDLNRFLFQQINAQIKYNEAFQIHCSSYRLKSGVMMDFVFAMNSELLAYCIGTGKNASASQIQFAESYLKRHPHARVLLLHLGESIRSIHPQIIEAPLYLIV